jgi:hypothetical protein
MDTTRTFLSRSIGFVTIAVTCVVAEGLVRLEEAVLSLWWGASFVATPLCGVDQ